MRNAVIGDTLLAGSAVIADAPGTALLPALLQRLFPRSWQSLVRVKALVDRIASLDAPAAMSRAGHQRRIAPLLVAAAQELNRFAMADNSGPGGTARAQAYPAHRAVIEIADQARCHPVVDQFAQGLLVISPGHSGRSAGLAVVHTPAAADDRAAGQTEQLLKVGPGSSGQRPRLEGPRRRVASRGGMGASVLPLSRQPNGPVIGPVPASNLSSSP
jgi:hypothetical protein